MRDLDAEAIGRERQGEGQADVRRSGETTPLELIWILVHLLGDETSVVRVVLELADRRWLTLATSRPPRTVPTRVGARCKTTLLDLTRLLVELIPDERAALDAMVALVRSRSLSSGDGRSLVLAEPEPRCPSGGLESVVR